MAPLDRVGWLAQQPESFRLWVSRVARWKTYDPGQILYLAGDAPTGVYGLASGSIEVSFPLIGEEPVAIYQAETGFWVGENALLADHPRLVTLTVAKESRLLHISGTTIRGFLTDHPEHWQAFYRLSSLNVNRVLILLSEALSLTVRARVCRVLLRLSGSTPDVEFTQDDLARTLGVVRSTMRRCLSELARLGALELGYGRIRVLDVSMLALFQDEQ